MIEQISLKEFNNFLESKARGVIEISNSIGNLQIEDSTIGNIKENFDSIKETILGGIDKINKRLKEEIKIISWNKLCIGFFGETNAGKSTLIEALIGGDGSSIGDGRKDFTREVQHLSYQNLELIDMPGIEGHEYNVREKIKKAVSKAHLIFYVITSNKEPEKLTLPKIENYLGSKIKIYLIINKRCDISAFKYNIFLEDENVKKIVERTQNHMYSVFGKKYCGYLVCHALLGYLARGKPKSDVLKKAKERALNMFKDTKEMFAHSGLSDLEELIKNTQKDVNYIIISSNATAIIRDMSVILSKILKNKKEFDRNIKSAQESFEKKNNELLNFLPKARHQLIKKININIDSEKTKLYNIISNGIEKKLSKDEISHKIGQYKQNLKQKLSSEVESEMEKIREELNKIVEELRKRFELQIHLSSKIKLDIDIDNIFEKMETSIGSIIKNIFSIVTVLIGSIVTGGSGWIIASIVSSIFTLWDFFLGEPEKRKKEAKKEAFSKISEETDKIKKQIIQNINVEFSKIENKAQVNLYDISRQFEGLLKISSEFNNYILTLKRTKAEISTYLLRLLTNKNVDAYIDMVGNNQFLAIIGANNIEEKILDMLSIKKKNVFYFESLKDFKKSLDSISKDLESKDNKLEFLRRTSEAFG